MGKLKKNHRDGWTLKGFLQSLQIDLKTLRSPLTGPETLFFNLGNALDIHLIGSGHLYKLAY